MHNLFGPVSILMQSFEYGTQSFHLSVVQRKRKSVYSAGAVGFIFPVMYLVEITFLQSPWFCKLAGLFLRFIGNHHKLLFFLTE